MGEVQFAKQFLTTLDAKTTKYQPDHVFDVKSFQTRVPYTLPRLSHPPHPLPPSSSSASAPPPGSTAATPSISVVLKSARNPTLSLTLPDLDPTSTTIQSLKESVQSTLGGSTVVAVDKIKILLNKKPIPASKKTISEALADQDEKKPSGVEFGVMVMGGAPDPPPQAQPPPVASPIPSGPDSEVAAAEAAGAVPPPPPEPMEGVTKSESTTVTAPSNPSLVQLPGEAPTGAAALTTSEFWDDLQGFLEQRLKDQGEAKKVRGVFEGAWKAASG